MTVTLPTRSLDSFCLGFAQVESNSEPFLIPLRELVGVLPDWQIDQQKSGQAQLPSEAEEWLVERLGLATSLGGAAPQGDSQLGGGPTTGPLPTSWTRQVKRDASIPATTYAFQFGDRLLWKIGWAQDINERLAEVNMHVPDEVLNERWRLVLQQPWADSKVAYDMEQQVLEVLIAHRTRRERTMCSRRDLENAWTTATAAVPRALRRP